MDHSHQQFPVPDETGERYGLSGALDLTPVGVMLGARMDQCGPCERLALDIVAANPAVSTRLFELVGAAVYDTLGALPRAMTDPYAFPSSIHPSLRRVFAEAARVASPDGHFDRVWVYRFVAQMAESERAHACEAALTILVRLMRTVTEQALADEKREAGGGRA